VFDRTKTKMALRAIRPLNMALARRVASLRSTTDARA
jgi:hypothetical protein